VLGTIGGRIDPPLSLASLTPNAEETVLDAVLVKGEGELSSSSKKT
jgi:hypothetical protein